MDYRKEIDRLRDDYEEEQQHAIGIGHYDPTDELPLIDPGKVREKDNDFEVSVSSTGEWFIYPRYLSKHQGDTPVIAEEEHDHSGCDSGRTGMTDLDPMLVSLKPGVMIMNIRVTHVPEDTPAEPIYPDLIRFGVKHKNIGMSLKSEEGE